MIGTAIMGRGLHRNFWRGIADGLLCLLFASEHALAENSSASGSASSTDTPTDCEWRCRPTDLVIVGQ
jgi:hypothetical protein